MINEAITNLDSSVFHLINTSFKNQAFDVFFPVFTRLGENKILFLIIVLLFILGKKKEKITSIILFATLALSGIAVLALKHITHRPRPSFVYENVHLLGQPIASSFPSGHTTLATAICIVLCFKYRRLSPVFLLLAFLIGFSRVYLGQHYPTDVIAGFMVGAVAAIIVLYLERISQENKTQGAV